MFDLLLLGTASDLLTPAFKNISSSFEHIESGGYIVVKDTANMPPDLDQPGRVTDLEVVATNYDNKSITLKFTATGDDLYTGIGILLFILT
jgi:hypothetical protein